MEVVVASVVVMVGIIVVVVVHGGLVVVVAFRVKVSEGLTPGTVIYVPASLNSHQGITPLEPSTASWS